MAGKPSLQFYPGDWMKDPALSMCGPLTRGIWIDFLCAIHEYDHAGQITGTAEQLARVCRCSVVDLRVALGELKQTHTADVTERNGQITVVCRRMAREAKERKNNALRQKKYREKKRSNASVTDYIEDEVEEEDNGEEEKEGAGEKGETPADSPAEDSPPPAGWSMEWDPEFQHHPAVIAFSETFPSQRLTQRQREMIGTAIGTVPDRVALWRTTTLARWDVNDYSARNIFDLIRSFGQDLSTQKARASPGARRPLTVPEAATGTPATGTPATVTPDKLPYQPPPPVGSVDRIGKLDQIERFGTADDDYTEIQTSEGTRWMPSLEAMQRMEAIKRRAS